MSTTEEQPLPKGDPSIDIANLVCADIQARANLGAERYGERLHPHNGRSALRDAYEEALDLCNYLRQEIYERETKEVTENAKTHADLSCYREKDGHTYYKDTGYASSD
jgi:hypothetical protein